MKIQYLGHSSFILKGKQGSVVTDPYDSAMVGVKFPSVEADIVTVSHQHADHNQSQLIGGEKIVFDFPGEYERKGIRVFGYQTYHDAQNGSERGENIMFKIIIDDVVVLHCGDLGHVPADDLIEQVKDSNVVLVPVGGFFTIGPKEAVELVKLLNPEVVIPMHFNHPKVKQDAFGQLAPVSEFLKLMGKEGLAAVSKFEVTVDSLPDKEVVLLDC